MGGGGVGMDGYKGARGNRGVHGYAQYLDRDDFFTVPKHVKTPSHGTLQMAFEK